MAGYLFQCRLALLYNLGLTRRDPEAIVSIEKFDDIAFETEDHANCLIQAKHHVVSKLLGDKSEDVWKTLLIWIEGSKYGISELSKTTYMLVTIATCPSNSAMSNLRDKASKESIEKAYDVLRAAAQDSANSATKTARSSFIDMTDSKAKLLLSHIVVIDSHPSLTDVFFRYSLRA